MKKIIEPGQTIPPFYGIAYRDYSQNVSVCYPLGINLIVILLSDTYYWLKCPKQG